jgi:uncharacterized protein (DUF885 family)
VLSFRMNNGSRLFEGLLARYFENLLQTVPTFAVVAAGLREGEGKLEIPAAKFHERLEHQRQKTLRALETISPRDLDRDQQLDRLGLRSHLLKECEDFQRGRHKAEPSAPEHLLNILLHELMRGSHEPTRAARNLRSLLRRAVEFLEAASAVLGRPEKVWLRVMEQAVAGAPVLLEGVGKFLKGVGDDSGDESQLRSVARAMDRYAEKARSRRLASAGSFAIGTNALQRRVRDELGLDYTLGQVEAVANGEIERVSVLLQQEAEKFGRGKKPAHLLERWRGEWRPEKPLLALYQAETQRVAEGFRSAKVVSFPKGDILEVKPVPEFLRNLIPTAAYSQPGAFEKKQRGVFWVNDLSQTKTLASEKLAEQQQHFGLSLTCAHEAYPGHHLQFVTANRNPRKWRRLFAHAVFYEGWTLWCEQMMIDLRIDRSPWIRLQQLHDALWRCHRILVDLRLQTGRYSYEQAVRHMQKHLDFTRARAEADVNWYTAQPGVPMSYWLGRLENERLRARLMIGRGWSLRKFNDWLLSFGTIPQAWIEKYGLD